MESKATSERQEEAIKKLQEVRQKTDNPKLRAQIDDKIKHLSENKPICK